MRRGLSIRAGRPGAAPSVLLPPAAAISRLIAGREPVSPRPVPLEGALGRILAEPIAAGSPVPARPVALREGWALASEATVGASSYSPAWLAEPPARVRVGDPLPEGADAVLPVEAVETGPAQALLAASPGENVRRAGEDAPAGAILRPTGRRIGPLDLAVALAAGVERCLIREPLIGLVGAETSEGIAGFLAAEAEGQGAALARFASAGETVEARPDLLVLVGDLWPDGAEVAARGLAIRPGEAVSCGTLGGVPALLVPPRLEAVAGAAWLVLRPCLRHLAASAEEPATWPGRLARKIASAPGLTEIALLRRLGAEFEPIAVGDLALAGLASAEAWIASPPWSEGWAEGARIEAHPLRP